jgi:hypothetical protein
MSSDVPFSTAIMWAAPISRAENKLACERSFGGSGRCKPSTELTMSKAGRHAESRMAAARDGALRKVQEEGVRKVGRIRKE